MGVGKSTIASKLASLLYCRCADLDTLIELGEDNSIEQIFQQNGESYFRELEEAYLADLIENCSEKVLVVSLGGGALLSQKNRDLVTSRTFCIYLKASVDTIAKRLTKARKSRPLVMDKNDSDLKLEIARLYKDRKPGYETAAKLTVDVDEKSLREILTIIMDSI